MFIQEREREKKQVRPKNKVASIKLPISATYHITSVGKTRKIKEANTTKLENPFLVPYTTNPIYNRNKQTAYGPSTEERRKVQWA